MAAEDLAPQELSVEKPIFIVGTGRCGSTALHRALSGHEGTAWLTAQCDRRPLDPRANRWALRILDLPLPGDLLRKLIYPVEAYRFWDHHCPGFGKPCRDLLKEDVTLATKRAVRRVMAQMLTAKRRRLLVKITGWPRTGFLREIFPDARFVHLYRDGRAVANSCLGVGWWSGWRGPRGWQWGELSPEHVEKWHRYDQSFIALAAIQWEILMSAQREAKQRIPPSSLLEVRYEEMCQDPLGTFQLIAEFCELEWTSGFEADIRRLSFENANYKWREQLNSEQRRILNECLYQTLREFGYA